VVDVLHSADGAAARLIRPTRYAAQRRKKQLMKATGYENPCVNNSF
jgi:hypothetical protein